MRKNTEPFCLENLIISYGRLVKSIIRSYFQNPEDIKDISALVWEKVHVSLPSLREEENPKAWISAVTRNCCIDNLRSRRKTVSLDAAVDTNQNPSSELEEKQDLELLREALGLLTDRERHIIVLFHIEGLPVKELAKRLGMSKSAVKTGLHRARLSLRDVLKTLKYL